MHCRNCGIEIGGEFEFRGVIQKRIEQTPYHVIINNRRLIICGFCKETLKRRGCLIGSKRFG